MEEDACIICYDNYTVGIVTECGHRCCLKCGLRYKFISNKSGCPICIKEIGDDEMMFKVTHSHRERFSNTEDSYVWANCIVCEPKDIETIEELLSRSCKLCKSEFYDSDTLVQHYKAKHKRHLCELCVKYRCEFPFEYVVYSMAELNFHWTDKSAGNNHPMCGFCRDRFYTQEALIKHCRKAHEVCYLCERLGKKNEYYKNYKELENHFKKTHYTCTEQMCLEARCYAFIDEIELAAHRASLHPAKKEKKIRIQPPSVSDKKKDLPRAVPAPLPKPEVPEHLNREKLLRTRNMKEAYTEMIKRNYSSPEEVTELVSQYDEMKLTLEELARKLRRILGDNKTIEFIERVSTYLLPDRAQDIRNNFPKLRRTIEFSSNKIEGQSPGKPPKQSTPQEKETEEKPKSVEKACEKKKNPTALPKTVKLAWSSALTRSAWESKSGPSVVKPVHISKLQIKLPSATKKDKSENVNGKNNDKSK